MKMSKLEIYKDRAGCYRWRLTAKNGERLCASSEAFSSKAKCKNNFKLVGKAVFEIAINN